MTENGQQDEEMGFFDLSSCEITDEHCETDFQKEKKMKKYEVTIKKLENINRLTKSKVRFFNNLINNEFFKCFKCQI